MYLQVRKMLRDIQFVISVKHRYIYTSVLIVVIAKIKNYTEFASI